MRGKTKRMHALLEQAITAIQSDGADAAAIKYIRDAQRLMEGPARSDKPPSAYNVFVKKTMQDLKAENPQLSNRERMVMCATRWREE